MTMVGMVALLDLGQVPQVFAQTDCSNKTGGAPTQPWRAGTAVVFTTPKLEVDADGAPNSYRIDGKGLSYTCDGVAAIVNGKRVTPRSDPQHWQSLCQQAWSRAKAKNDYSNLAIFGFAHNKKNEPIIQLAGDPLPGEAYVTTTKLTIPETPEMSQRQFVDATKIPYIVLSREVSRKYAIQPGDVAVVYRIKTRRSAFAIYGDEGLLGEGSVKLHFELGSQPITRISGVDRAKTNIGDKIVTVVFPGTNAAGTLDADAWTQTIDSAGADALRKWGGMDRLLACAGEQ
jgi:hypothetical protein